MWLCYPYYALYVWFYKSLDFSSITEMVLSEYAKIRILTLWRKGNGPTTIVEKLEAEEIITTRKTVTCFIAGYTYLANGLLLIYYNIIGLTLYCVPC